MTVVAVLGGGAGGLATSVDLALAGHEVRLWNRHLPALTPFIDDRVIRFVGELGDGSTTLSAVTTDLSDVLDGAECLVVSLPAVAHEMLFADLANLRCSIPVVLNPGHTGGALHARAVFRRFGATLPPLAELSTLTYVARVDTQGVAAITLRAGFVRGACLPGGRSALDAATGLFSSISIEPDVMATSLSNVNMVLHPPGAILSAAWVEAPDRSFTFYVDGLTPGVANVIRVLDEERRAVAAGFGHQLPSLVDEMRSVGTATGPLGDDDIAAAIRGGVANQSILAPTSLHDRYYEEDLPYAVTPLTVFADLVGAKVPMARALLTIGGGLLGRDLVSTGLGAHELGLDGLGLDGVLEIVRGCS